MYGDGGNAPLTALQPTRDIRSSRYAIPRELHRSYHLPLKRALSEGPRPDLDRSIPINPPSRNPSGMQWSAPLVLLLCLGCTCLGGCTSPLKQPTVTVTDITMQGVSLSSTSVLATVQVENPNPVGITIANLSFDLFYETGDGERYLGHGGRENLVIPKESTSRFDIPVEIGNVQALQAGVVLLREGSLTLVTRGTAAVDLKITTVRIPFEKRKVVP
jgi:LEA14-like dessication related protein